MKGLETNNTFIIVILMEDDEKQNQKVANVKFQWRNKVQQWGKTQIT